MFNSEYAPKSRRELTVEAPAAGDLEGGAGDARLRANASEADMEDSWDEVSRLGVSEVRAEKGEGVGGVIGLFLRT